MPQTFLAPCERIAPASSLVVRTWEEITREAGEAVWRERVLARAIEAALLRHRCFASALGGLIADRLAGNGLDEAALLEPIIDAFEYEPDIVEAAAVDLSAVRDRDAACPDLLTPFLYFKGYQALQAYRVSHHLWNIGRRHLARHFQSRMSEVFGVDIHPAARLGRGIMCDHATGLVIGETSVVEDDVSILQEVTLGGTGKESGDRHPKVRRGVLLGAGAKVLGNVEIGEGAKVGAGSIVLTDVEPYTTVVGVPARPVGPPNTGLPALTMDQCLPPPDYVI